MSQLGICFSGLGFGIFTSASDLSSDSSIFYQKVDVKSLSIGSLYFKCNWHILWHWLGNVCYLVAFIREVLFSMNLLDDVCLLTLRESIVCGGIYYMLESHVIGIHIIQFRPHIYAPNSDFFGMNLVACWFPTGPKPNQRTHGVVYVRLR